MIIDLLPSDDQRMIEQSVSALLTRALPIGRTRGRTEIGGGADRNIWPDFVELGLFGLGLSEAEGGVGFGLPEEVIAARALGRHLASPSVIATMFAIHLAAESGDQAACSALASGAETACYANMLADDEVQVIDGADACWSVVVGVGHVSLFDRASLTVIGPATSIDETLTLDHAQLSGGRTVGALADRGALLIAAYLTGIALATQDMAVAYACTREQFGRPIGSFQAVKHMCADMAVRAAAANAQVCHAAVTFCHHGDDAREVAAARLLAAQAARENAKANIQIHGAMGFTAECDAHLYLKRALVIDALGSSRRAEQRRMLAQ